MQTVGYSSEAARLLRDASVTPGNVSSLLKDFYWDQIFSKGDNTDAITTSLQELWPEERPSTIAFFADMIMNSCGSLSTSTNKKTELETVRPYKNEHTLEHYRRVATDKKNEYVSNVLRYSCEIASSQTV